MIDLAALASSSSSVGGSLSEAAAFDIAFDPSNAAADGGEGGAASSSSSSSSLFLASDGGMVLHASAHPDHRPTPRYLFIYLFIFGKCEYDFSSRVFRPEFDAMAACRSVSHCPYGEGYILAGSDDGTVRCGF